MLNSSRFIPKIRNISKNNQFLYSLRTVTSQNNDEPLPEYSKVVICGSGAISNCIAYNLIKNGWNDVLILEQNRVNSGTSNFGTGLIGLFKPIPIRNIIWESIKLYKYLEEELGYDVGLKQCGSLGVASTQDRMIAIRRRMTYQSPQGLECQLLNPSEIKEMNPLLNVDDLVGGVFVKEDAICEPNAVCRALIDVAKKNGVQYKENIKVKYVLTDKDKVVGVETDEGVVKCEYFVNCAGMWARELGLKTGNKTVDRPVKIPSYPAKHFYAITSGMTIDNPNLPCLRDYDSYSYSRYYNGELLVGWFETEASVCEDIPQDWTKGMSESFVDYDSMWSKTIHRFPKLKSLSAPFITNIPDNFTPDGRWVLGESAEVTNYFVGVGMNGNAIEAAGGVGKAIAEWIIEGRPTQELFPFNIQRFIDLHNNRQYLQTRVKEVVSRHYAIHYPYQSEYKLARKLRCSPLYSVLEQRGAVFGIKMAYERALYFDTTYKKGDKLPRMEPSFFKPKFFHFMENEYRSCRENVGIIDISSFSKIEVKATKEKDVVRYLQKICSNDIDIAVGSIIQTGMQNEQGGYENDCMIIRQEPNIFFIVSPSSLQTKIFEWMSNHLPTSSVHSKTSIKLTDQTSMFTVINVVGPKARKLMSDLSNSDMNLPPFMYKKVNIGYASDVMVLSFTHTGESGYCLYVPSEYAIHVYESLMKVGHDYGIRDVGTLTQRWMRIERFIPFWAEELTNFVTPFEAGMDHHVNLFKHEDFIGKEALKKQKETGFKKRLVKFLIEDIDIESDVWTWGSEPIYRNNQFVGTVTSAGYGFTLGKIVCLGFITRPSENGNQVITTDYVLDPTAQYTIGIAGNTFKATPYLSPHPLLSQRERDLRDASTSYKPTATVLSVKRNES